MNDWIALFKRWRTPVLGIASMIALIYGAIVIFEVETAVIINIFTGSLLLATTMIFLALAVTLVRVLIRRIFENKQ